jgi:hypothetical protein
MNILELIHLLLAPFTFFNKAFLELIINGGNVKSLLQNVGAFGIKEPLSFGCLKKIKFKESLVLVLQKLQRFVMVHERIGKVPVVFLGDYLTFKK